jgi:hypothetical protein
MVDLDSPPVTVQSEPIPASQSRVIISACVTILASVLGLAGIAMTQFQQDTLTNLLVALAPLAATLVTGIVTIWARRKTSAPIKGGPADPEMIAKKLLDDANERARKQAFGKYTKGL